MRKVASSRSGFFAMSDQSVKSLALVGQFLHQWSQMEQTIHLAISAATKLDPLMNTIVCANLTIREKLNILRTLVDTSDITPEGQKASFKAMLRDIGDYTPARNMLAHDFFMVGDEVPSIVFMPIKAKGKFDTPYVSWGELEFVEQYEKIDAFTTELEKLSAALEHALFSADRLELPTQRISSTRRARRPFRQPLEPPGSDPATPKKEGGSEPPSQE